MVVALEGRQMNEWVHGRMGERVYGELVYEVAG